MQVAVNKRWVRLAKENSPDYLSWLFLYSDQRSFGVFVTLHDVFYTFSGVSSSSLPISPYTHKSFATLGCFQAVPGANHHRTCYNEQTWFQRVIPFSYMSATDASSPLLPRSIQPPFSWLSSSQSGALSNRMDRTFSILIPIRSSMFCYIYGTASPLYSIHARLASTSQNMQHFKLRRTTWDSKN